MTDRVVQIPSNTDWETPPGWRVLQYFGANIFSGGKPVWASITDEPLQVITESEPESLHIPSTMCGATHRGSICGFSTHTGRHSFEPEDSEDSKSIWGKSVVDYCNSMARAVSDNPAENGTFINREYHPAYYQTESGITPWDVIEAFNLDYWCGSAVAHILKAGRKPADIEGADSVHSDIQKAYTFLAERLRMTNESKHRGPTNVG